MRAQVKMGNFLKLFYRALLTPFLHSFVAGAACAFGAGPADVVEGAFTLTGLAVQAIGGIGGLDHILNGFIYARGTKGDAGAIETGGAFSPADIGIEN